MTALRLALLSLLPSLGATGGAAVDEYQYQGFSTWRSACRAGEVSLGSLISFTRQLLPNAIIGLLLGGLAVQGLGFVLRERGNRSAECVAAHVGCLLAMPVGLLICAQSMPAMAMPFADALLAMAAALLVLPLLTGRGKPRRLHP